MVYRIGVIGLGIMGNRMLDRLAQHPDLEAAAGWDPSADARERTKKAHPTLAPDASAEALCRRADLDCIYIASPPASHIAHAFAAFDAGKPVFVEKPLATDLKEAEAIVARATREKRAAAINFSLAHAPGLIVLEDTIRSGRFGKPVAASVEVEFAAWPRPWQMGAAPGSRGGPKAASPARSSRISSSRSSARWARRRSSRHARPILPATARRPRSTRASSSAMSMRRSRAASAVPRSPTATSPRSSSSRAASGWSTG